MQNGHHYSGFERESSDHEEDEYSTSLTDELDHHILMHRDAHFGGDFGVMLNYYMDEDHIGVEAEFDYDRIAYLAEVEKGLGKDLAAMMLSGAEAEAVARARTAYAKLKEIYAGAETEENRLARKVADLILTEHEEPEQELESVISEQEKIVPHLLALIGSDEMYDPLFPGYGYAPCLAAIALGALGDSRALIPLFEMLSKPVVFDEMVVVDALGFLGVVAQNFLLQQLSARPITQDNIHAAFALSAFSEEAQVAKACFDQLKLPEVQEKPLFCSYLVNNCAALDSKEERGAFIQMAKEDSLAPNLRKEMETVIKGWRN